MLRVHFTAGDIARTRVADGPDPLWESVLSLHQLRERNRERALDDWRSHVLGHGSASLRLLLPLVPARGYFPDFLTPPEGSEGFEAGLESMLSTPRSQLRAEIEKLSRGQPRPPCSWTRSVAEGSAPVLHRLGEAMRDYRRVAFGASWQRLCAGIEGDRTWRARVQWYSGTEAMLRTFAPRIRWNPPVLECDYPMESDMHLRGRGLLLVPSYFCRRTPVALADPTLPPTLVYPARAPDRSGHMTGSTAEETGAHLARLLGVTRAAVLQSVGGNCTTTELARRAGVSVSSASEHAAVLRGAGLIASSRERNAVRHMLTPVGLALLDERPGVVIAGPATGRDDGRPRAALGAAVAETAAAAGADSS
ncbi:ArsR/SmtB family transcription factor [Streptomyces abyssalis]|uniref:ArsR/SmtB family transcription factor n=1 Tax=Streptomyces abyssalis TaxID=933944 RepID=UPI00085CD4DA|nr:winged helix-turn-helix domain-containing protein [Streptomyces abyssalis]